MENTICRNCGLEQEISNNFCENCGSKLIDEVEESPRKTRTPVKKRRSGKLLLIIPIILLLLGAGYILPGIISGELDATGIRYSGTNRYSTAYEIAKANETKGDTVIIVQGRNDDGGFPVIDGLLASGLAGAKNAQILLTESHALPQETLDALEELGASTAIIVGGRAAVDDDVHISLERLGLNVHRISGVNRYDTALKVARSMGSGKNNTAIIVNGDSEIDSLVAGPLAHKGYPILMVDNNRETVPDETKQAFEELNIDKVIIIGSRVVVSERIEEQLNAFGVEVEARYGGEDRIETSLLLAEHPELKNENRITLINGWNYSDGVLASTLESPIIYFNSNSGITEEIEEYIKNKRGFQVIGGTTVVSEGIFLALERLFE